MYESALCITLDDIGIATDMNKWEKIIWVSAGPFSHAPLGTTPPGFLVSVYLTGV